MKEERRKKKEKENLPLLLASSSTPPRFEAVAIGRTERPQPLPSQEYFQLVSRQSRESAISTYSSVSIRHKEYIDLKVVSRGAPLLIRCVGGP
jgi:hypothetical protein